jgi:hypothetical protein
MTNNQSAIQQIAIGNLLIDLQNPRYDPRTNQREAIMSIANDQGMKLANLAEDIVEKGLNPSELPIVTQAEGGNNTFIVLEGNRRITALKLLASPSLVTGLGLPENIAKKYKALQDKTRGTIPNIIECAVLSREEASHWIYIRHTGENEGIGVVTWDGIQTHRFRGASPAFQAIELVKSSDYLDEATKKKLPKISITNIERVLGTPEARKHLGVDVKDRQLILRMPEEEAIARLSIIVTDVANKRITVSDIETREDRVNYAQDVASRPLPKLISGTEATTTGKSTDSVSGKDSSTKSIAPDRKTIIPKRFKLSIVQPRINRIYHELQKLNSEQFVNCCAVMFRVFVELSLDDFAQRHNISLRVTQNSKPSAIGSKPTSKEMTLREKLSIITNFLETNGSCNKAELKGVRALIANRDHVLSVDSLNAYVHNKDYSPTPMDLRITWDNLQVFIERLWTI